MTSEQKEQITQLRSNGCGYMKISQMMNISVNTVKSYCRRNEIEKNVPAESDMQKNEQHICRNCGKKVTQNPGRKEKKFCSDRCRNHWWNEHPDMVRRKANYEYICPCCKKKFTAYGNSGRKYCSHDCYIRVRFGGK